MKSFKQAIYLVLFLVFSVTTVNAFTTHAEASTTTSTSTSKHKEMNKKIAAIQKKYQANEYDTYHLYNTYQVSAKVQDDLYKGYNKESKDKISKAKAALLKLGNDNSLYGKSKIKQLKRIIIKQETNLKINKVTLEAYDKNYPMYKLFMDGLLMDSNNQKAQILMIKINYYNWKAVTYAWQQDTPVLFKCYDEINNDLEMWKNSNDSHKEERIKSLTNELEDSNNGYTALDLKKTQTANLESSKIYYAFFKELYNVVKNY